MKLFLSFVSLLNYYTSHQQSVFVSVQVYKLEIKLSFLLFFYGRHGFINTGCFGFSI